MNAWWSCHENLSSSLKRSLSLVPVYQLCPCIITSLLLETISGCFNTHASIIHCYHHWVTCPRKCQVTVNRVYASRQEWQEGGCTTVIPNLNPQVSPAGYVFRTLFTMYRCFKSIIFMTAIAYKGNTQTWPVRGTWGMRLRNNIADLHQQRFKVYLTHQKKNI